MEGRRSEKCVRQRCLPRIIPVVLLCVMSVAAFSQTSPAYQTGTILEVRIHKPASEKESSIKQYEVSVKIADTMYVVLVPQPAGSNVLEYKIGLDFPVLVQEKTLRFSDLLGRTVTVPILSQQKDGDQKAE